MRWLLLLTLGALGGCLERTETITLRQDGSLAIEHRLVGDGDDLAGGAARYPGEEAWAMKHSSRVKDDGEREWTVIASATFPSADRVPTRFGDPDDPRGARGLRFRTKVDIERDGARTTYRFERVYRARRWAPYRVFWRQSFPPHIQEMIDDPDSIPERSRADRRALIAAIVDYQRRQFLYWAGQALAVTVPAGARRDDALLAVRKRIGAFCKRHLDAKAVERVLSEPVDEIEAFSAAMRRRVFEEIVAEARVRLELDAAAASRLESELALHHHDFEVSHDLEDENFIVRLEMPGRLVASNADRTEDGMLVWAFHGKDLRDVEHRLIAVSVVETR